MTDRLRRARPRRPRPTAVVASSLALLLAIFTLLAWQMRAGRDPALGAAAQATRPAAPRTVIVRRVVVTKRYVVVVEDEQEGAPPATRTSAPAQSAAPAPAQSAAPAPAQAPAAQTPAPQPAPAPAPVVTRTS
jgi:hypothetical protein